MAIRQFVDQYLGKKMYFEHSSYSCPALSLYGYSTERTLKTAMARKLVKVRRV